MLQYEILHRGLFINKITYKIKDILSNCEICVIHKLNNFIKPADKHIISKQPLERLLVDITYFNKKIGLLELKEKYLLCFTDNFSKFSKCYLFENKESKTVLNKFKDFIKNYGKPKMLHTDNGGIYFKKI